MDITTQPQVHGNGDGLLVDAGGRPIPSILTHSAELDLHPLDDPAIWAAEPSHRAPAEVDIVAAQKWIDSIMGQTRNNDSIYKLVWSGDTRYWLEYFTKWDAYGKPLGDTQMRPMIRWKTIRDAAGTPVRDVFPPRWILLTRLEPEQYADNWAAESYIEEKMLVGHYVDAEFGLQGDYRTVQKQVRPLEPPPVFWMFYATVAKHSHGCCARAERNKHKCYGEYASPYYMREFLEGQAQADREAKMTPFAMIQPGQLSEINNESNGYIDEIKVLLHQQQLFIENPMALLGVHASLAADIGPKEGRRLVSDYFDRQIDEKSKHI